MNIMWDELFSRINKKKIALDIDPQLHNHITHLNPNITSIQIRLFNLIIAIGMGRTRRITKRVKFTDAAEFLERFIEHNSELRIKLIDDVDDKTRIAHEIGEGLSILMAEMLFGVKRTEISKIPRKGKESKPDFEGYTAANTKIVWESKGTTSSFANSTITHAIEQKSRHQATASFVSLSTLKTDSMTEVKLLDPPTLPLSGDNLEKALTKVKHYINLFNFIGQAKICRYFKYAAKRYAQNTNFTEFSEKVELFKEIRADYPILRKGDYLFYGNIEQISEGIYSFVGFDQRLLSVFDLLSFEEYREDFSFTTGMSKEDTNNFFVSKDGICYGLLKNFIGIERVNTNNISYRKDNVSIADIDNMYEYELQNLMEYYFNKEKIEFSKEIPKAVETKFKTTIDGIINVGDISYILEIKTDGFLKTFNHLKQLKRYLKNDKGLLITNQKISSNDLLYAKKNGIIIIDREGLKKIIKKKLKLTSFLDS